MSTRWRIFLAALVLVVVPAGLLAGFFRQQLLGTIEDDFAATSHEVLQRNLRRVAITGRENRLILSQLGSAAADDNRLRHALIDGREDLRSYLVDYAGRIASTTNLDALALLDDEGRILSSAHHRNEFGVDDGSLLESLMASPGFASRASLRSGLLDREILATQPDVDSRQSAFAFERTPQRRFLAVLTHHEFTLGGQRFHWIGGREAGLSHGPARGGLVAPDTVITDAPLGLQPGTGAAGDLTTWGRETRQGWLAAPAPLILEGSLVDAMFVSSTSLHRLQWQRRRTDQLMLAILAAVLVGALLLASYASWLLSRPLVNLARQAERIDLDHPAADFRSTRSDEVGKLARVLQTMVGRLRTSAHRLARAEHRATLGELARQVNHDLRNGITPVRNVMRHLGETADQEPDQLGEVFARRRNTLDSSLAYLEDLAGHYAKLAPEPRRQACDLATLAAELATAHPQVVLEADADAPPVLADPVSLRRILGNLVRNALEALPDGQGQVIVRVAADRDPDLGVQCALVVSDDGEGMPPEVRDRVLEDFFTTKPGGSGLGLSNVRRLAGDAGGRIAIESEPGRGTTITVTFPGAESES